MDYDGELVAGTAKELIGNLIVDVELNDGKIEPAFCGAVEIAEMCRQGMPVLLLREADDTRILKNKLLFLKTSGGWIFADPKYNRALFKEAFVAKKIEELCQYKSCRALKHSEAKGIDFELTGENGEKGFVFVTSIYNKKDGCAAFPQKMNFFEMKMLEEMRSKIVSGAKVFILMIAPREDCDKAKFSWDIDPLAAAAMYDAAKFGINFICYNCKIEENNISLHQKMRIIY